MPRLNEFLEQVIGVARKMFLGVYDLGVYDLGGQFALNLIVFS